MNRYARQMILPEIGPDGQARLGQAKLLVVGAGGLGCPVLQYLVGAGAGQITVVDPDVVDLSNLHRQPLYLQTDQGRSKAKTACARLSDLNAEVTLTPLEAALTPANAGALVAAADLVIDAADSFAATYILSDVCLAQNKPLIAASVLGLSGYVGGFCGGAPSYRAVFPELPQNTQTCATAGVMGPVVGMFGAIQAQMALSVLLGLEPAPLGQLVTIDMGSLRFGGFSFQGASEPEGSVLPFIAPGAFRAADRVIDLRGPEEAPVPASPVAERVLPEEIAEWVAPRDQRIVLCCRSGLRAWRAARALQKRGIDDLALVAMGD